MKQCPYANIKGDGDLSPNIQVNIKGTYMHACLYITREYWETNLCLLLYCPLSSTVRQSFDTWDGDSVSINMNM